MKEMIVTPPSGYEIDPQRSTFQKIVFREIDKKREWEVLPIKVEGYYLFNCEIREYTRNSPTFLNKDVWPTKELAEAALALSQLMQWRKHYLLSNGYENWKPDFSSNLVTSCWCIFCRCNELCLGEISVKNSALSFPYKGLAKKFKEEFRVLLLTAKPLL